MTSLPPEIVFRTAIVVIAFILAIAIISTNSQWISDTLRPLFGFKQPDTYQTQVNKNSVGALACAVNIVGSGELQECRNEYKDTPLSGDSTANGASGNFLVEEDEKDPKEVDAKDIAPADRVKIDCTVEAGGIQKCELLNFKMPQIVSDWDEWIPWHGDPEYLLYWQNFPPEEDMWTYKTNWKVYFVIGAISILPPLKSAKIVAGTAIRSGINAILRKVGKEAAEKAITKGVSRSMVKSAVKKSVNDMVKRKVITKSVGSNILRQVTNANIDAAMREAGEAFGEKWARAAVTEAPKLAQEYAQESALNSLIRAGANDISEEAFEKLGKEAAESAGELSLKYMGVYGLKEQFKDLILQRIAGKQLPLTAISIGSLTLAERATVIAENMYQARYEIIPNKLVLKRAMEDPIEYDLVDELNGKPILITVPNREDYFILPQIFDIEKPFHLVSPCELESVEVRKINAKCEDYTINKNAGGQDIYMCTGDIEISNNGQPCDLQTYEINQYGLGPLDYLQKITEIPEDMKVIFDIDNVVDEGKTGNGFIEYQEGCPTTINCGSSNVFYSFNEGLWYWKSPEGGVDNWRPVSRIYDQGWKTFEDDYDLETVHFDLMNGLVGKDFNEGIGLIRDVLNKDKDSKGGKTSDDGLTIHTPFGTVPISASNDYSTLSQEVQYSMALSPPYYRIPVAQNTYIYFDAESGYTKIVEVNGDIEKTYEVLALDAGGSTLPPLKPRILVPMGYDKIKDIRLYKMMSGGENVPFVMEVDVEDWASQNWQAMDVNDKFIITGLYPQRAERTDVMIDVCHYAREIVTTLSNGCILETKVAISDEGDNGTVKSINMSFLESSGTAKVMTDFSDDTQGIGYFKLKNCVTPGVHVFMSKNAKTDTKPNYCTGGLSDGKAWLEFGGDVVMLIGIGVGTYLGGLPGIAIAAFGEITEVSTEYMSEKMGEWPNSW